MPSLSSTSEAVGPALVTGLSNALIHATTYTAVFMSIVNYYGMRARVCVALITPLGSCAGLDVSLRQPMMGPAFVTHDGVQLTCSSP